MLFKLYGIFIWIGSLLGGGGISVDLSQKGGATQKRLGTTALEGIDYPQLLLQYRLKSSP